MKEILQLNDSHGLFFTVLKYQKLSRKIEEYNPQILSQMVTYTTIEEYKYRNFKMYLEFNFINQGENDEHSTPRD